MSQQINLSMPVLLTQRRYFSATAMVWSLALFLLVGGALSAYGVWSLTGATRQFQAVAKTQAPELVAARANVAAGRLALATDGKTVAQDLLAARALLAQRNGVLQELRRGLIVPGQGLSAQLALVAQTIPSRAWITAVQLDLNALEVRGFTEDPAQLNDWVASLAGSPLLAGQQLDRVRVERAVAGSAPGRPESGPAAPTGMATSRSLWSFTLTSSTPANRP